MASSGVLNFAIERDYDAEAQVMGMELEGIDIAVMFPTMGLNLIARDNMELHLSLALCQAYNNWIYDFDGVTKINRLKEAGFWFLGNGTAPRCCAPPSWPDVLTTIDQARNLFAERTF